ncbi:MAG: trehalose-phosphatase [Hyphomicrobiaceae bacterium]
MGLRPGNALCGGEQSAAQTPETASAPASPTTASSLPAPASIDCKRDALFLDFDGTLAEIAPAPNLVAFTPEARAVLETLEQCFSGALAIVTGRQVSEIDHHLAPLKLPVSALYGLVHRSSDGAISDLRPPGTRVAHASAVLKKFVEQHPGLLLELKGQTIALHYRARPEMGHACRAAARAALDGEQGLKLIDGKMVVEIAPAEADKGRAVLTFLDEPPFFGRRPVYIGDDVSDEAAFKVAQELGGVAIKIGRGRTAAQYRAADNADILQWLRAVAANAGRKVS